jgi:RNA polymerase sigma factor (sigma-70 family)
MNDLASLTAMSEKMNERAKERLNERLNEEDRRISQIVAEQRSRLRNFIRKRVADEADVEDLLQEVFYELVRANRLLMPIEYVTGWLYRVARNRITDLFRKKKPQTFTDTGASVGDEEDDGPQDDWLKIEDLLPSPEAGPDAAYVRHLLLEEMEAALAELPAEQREVFIAHELEGRSFKELAAESGVSINTLLSRKRYAVLHLRERLQNTYEELIGS